MLRDTGIGKWSWLFSGNVISNERPFRLVETVETPDHSVGGNGFSLSWYMASPRLKSWANMMLRSINNRFSGFITEDV